MADMNKALPHQWSLLFLTKFWIKNNAWTFPEVGERVWIDASNLIREIYVKYK